jgi:hypothetical protein
MSDAFKANLFFSNNHHSHCAVATPSDKITYDTMATWRRTASEQDQFHVRRQKRSSFDRPLPTPNWFRMCDMKWPSRSIVLSRYRNEYFGLLRHLLYFHLHGPATSHLHAVIGFSKTPDTFQHDIREALRSIYGDNNNHHHQEDDDEKSACDVVAVHVQTDDCLVPTLQNLFDFIQRYQAAVTMPMEAPPGVLVLFDANVLPYIDPTLPLLQHQLLQEKSHLGCSTLIMASPVAWTASLDKWATQMDYVYMFAETDTSARQHMYKAFARMLPSYNDFNALFESKVRSEGICLTVDWTNRSNYAPHLFAVYNILAPVLEQPLHIQQYCHDKEKTEKRSPLTVVFDAVFLMGLNLVMQEMRKKMESAVTKSSHHHHHHRRRANRWRASTAAMADGTTWIDQIVRYIIKSAPRSDNA